MSIRIYRNLIDTEGGKWHCAPGDPAHSLCDMIVKAGWETPHLPVSSFITGRVPPDAAKPYTEILLASDEDEDITPEYDDFILEMWEIEQQLSYLVEKTHAIPQDS